MRFLMSYKVLQETRLGLVIMIDLVNHSTFVNVPHSHWLKHQMRQSQTGIKLEIWIRISLAEFTLFNILTYCIKDLVNPSDSTEL